MRDTHTSRHLVAGVAIALGAVVGCRDEPPPPPAPSPTSSILAPVTSTSAEPRHAASDEAPPLHPLPAASHPYTGGVWSSCADAYRVSDHPQRDVTRLSLLCAPYQGMRRHGRTWFGEVGPDREGSFDSHLRKDQCGRVFAVAPSELKRFRIEVTSPSGKVVGVARSKRGFAMVNPRGAFCVEETGTYRTRVIGEGGSGTVAAELWTLPEN